MTGRRELQPRLGRVRALEKVGKCRQGQDRLYEEAKENHRLCAMEAENWVPKPTGVRM